MMLMRDSSLSLFIIMPRLLFAIQTLEERFEVGRKEDQENLIAMDSDLPLEDDSDKQGVKFKNECRMMPNEEETHLVRRSWFRRSMDKRICRTSWSVRRKRRREVRRKGIELCQTEMCNKLHGPSTYYAYCHTFKLFRRSKCGCYTIDQLPLLLHMKMKWLNWKNGDAVTSSLGDKTASPHTRAILNAYNQYKRMGGLNDPNHHGTAGYKDPNPHFHSRKNS